MLVPRPMGASSKSRYRSFIPNRKGRIVLPVGGIKVDWIKDGKSVLLNTLSGDVFEFQLPEKLALHVGTGLLTARKGGGE